MKTVACDVLVAGSGVAGFTAALKLHSQGRNVIMVEKEPLFGGTSAATPSISRWRLRSGRLPKPGSDRGAEAAWQTPTH
jgi:succinate dehydrogenase/fumarate reductase flavoprotein subunit